MPIEYEKAKQQYWQERQARETEFAKKYPEGQFDHKAFSKAEAAHLKEVQQKMKSIPGAAKAERAIAKQERAEDKPSPVQAKQAAPADKPSPHFELKRTKDDKYEANTFYDGKKIASALYDTRAEAQDDIDKGIMQVAKPGPVHAKQAESEKEAKAIQEGSRGGRYYVSAAGSKIYVKNNPGAEVVGQVSQMPFQSGLPAACIMQEPYSKGGKI